jgi:xanthine dehydrogenase accessory factor
MTIARLGGAAREALAAAACEGSDGVIVSVARIDGSTPREAGAAMFVTATSALGTIGGGHLELKSIAAAREALAAPAQGGEVLSVTRRFPLGPALGQCCGGVAHVRFDVCRAGVMPGGLQVAPPPALFILYLFGAGHVGQALVDVLAQVDCEVVWIDSREQQFPARVPANTRVEFSDAPEMEVASAPTGAFYLVLTHSHALDLAIVERILKRGDAGFAGMVGSRTKRVTFERRLRERGIGDTALQGLTCPIGMPGITGKAPGVVAIAAAAQLLAVATRHTETGAITARAT